ncbi:MAG: SAM-dependent methyltransferase [Chryseobacterium sp. 39-10]|uniref:class I SAM-dependent methyltransferase n=1 Tax=Elizabethkingia occulta TaxID=1867263 RepID=UPI00092A455C|nr:class I SAM-dependent methyltransferase [Elizabethkingia occulta]MBN9313624.1 methyltransferase domain-containing protein [Chryseobacterium sp.]OJV46741.1 MAG: SAM-dependent methyltransferase [Chryseobacterium sp. 39-10]OPB98084.1 SAM-dependent methyltransferase [Elizabethkingia occulta]
MENFNRKTHWENIYENKPLETVSWYQPNPETSLNFISQFNLPKTAKIIDIGGGDSFFVDHLLDLGYQDITVLDISNAAIERAKTRLGNNASKVKWIVSDASEFQPKEQYEFWHDRAAFHFLTDEKEIGNYIKTTTKVISENGIMVIGTFSEQGPKKCSGIDIRQYSESTMTELFQTNFEKIECITVDHKTPFDTIQNFVFCSFRKK